MKSRIRIVHLGKFYPPAPGGIESHLQTLARIQANMGLQVQVSVVNHEDPHGRDSTFDSLTQTGTVDETDEQVQIHREGRIVSLARLDICPGLLKHLRSTCQRGVDLVHLHTPNPTMLLALLTVGTRAPIVITHHSDIIRQKTLRQLLNPFERVVYGRAARVIASTPPYIEGSPLLQRFREKVRVIPFGIDLEDFLAPSTAGREYETRWRETYGQPLWLMVGRLIYYKGMDTALRALQEVPGKLVVIGNGPLNQSLRELATELGVADRVAWRGHVSRDELIGAYRAATAFWFPSNARSEAFGLVQLEAMASGCPVINTNIPQSGVPWVSPDGVSGLTVPMNDPRSLAAVARRLLEPDSLRQRLSDQAQQRCREEFTREKMAERTVQLYREIVH